MMPELPRIIPLSTLMKNDNKLLIQHAEQCYLLSITRKGKLILTGAQHYLESINQKCIAVDTVIKSNKT